MTYLPGDPGHIDVHVALRAELASMGATTLPSDPQLGDPGHVDDHAAIRTALLEVASSWGLTLPPELLPPEPVLGQPDHVLDHNTADDAIAWLWANGWNAATGGSEWTIPNYNGTGQTWKVHEFTSTQTLTVTRNPRPFSVLLVGGGLNGGAASPDCCTPTLRFGGAGGAGGRVLEIQQNIGVGARTITIGAGNGGITYLGGITDSTDPRATQEPGGARGGGSPSNGGNGGPGKWTTITGDGRYYGAAGGGGAHAGNHQDSRAGGQGGTGNGHAGNGAGASTDCCAPGYIGNGGSAAAGWGGGGGGGSVVDQGYNCCGAGGAGGSGHAVIAYRIA
jgi:hypothetical protein